MLTQILSNLNCKLKISMLGYAVLFKNKMLANDFNNKKPCTEILSIVPLTKVILVYRYVMFPLNIIRKFKKN